MWVQVCGVVCPFRGGFHRVTGGRWSGFRGCPRFLGLSSLPWCVPFLPSWHISSRNRAKRGKSYILFARFGVFSGIWDTERGENKDIFYFWGLCGAAFILFCGGGGGVHWVQVVQGAGASGVLRCVFRPFLPAFLSALSLCLWYITPEYGSISRFKGVFSAVYMVCVGLCCLRALRGLWGFCARVWLGGLEACCVFASILYLLPCFLSCCLCFPLVVVLCSGCLYLSSCIVFVALWVCFSRFFFPFGIYAKRKGAPCWCVLSRPVVGLCS